MSTCWVVGLEQRQPYEFVQLEVFSEESDACAFAQTWAEPRPARQLARRTWALLDQDGVRLVVRRGL